MANEEAIAIIKSECYVMNLLNLDRTQMINEALDMAIKALEQGDVLDKIRAEIEKLRPNLRPEQMTDYDYAMVEVVDDIVAIIDKYKAESEE